MDRFVATGEASDKLGASMTTLRRWVTGSKPIPERTAERHLKTFFDGWEKYPKFNK